MRENTLLLRWNSVQALFNGYYFDSSIAAIQTKKEGKSMIQDDQSWDDQAQTRITKNDKSQIDEEQIQEESGESDSPKSNES